MMWFAPSTRLATCRLVALFVTLATAQAGRADPIQTYIALGDSIAYGQTNVQVSSYGDQGYVKAFADYLATQNNGIRPNVVNLAIPGELSSTYFSGDNPPGYNARQLGALANINYNGDTTLSQSSKFASVVASAKAAGQIIKAVTFALGSNDFFFLAANPNFNAQTAPQMIQQAFANLQANYLQALAQIRAAAPNAQLYLLNYYNPFAFLGPQNPNNQLSMAFTTGQDQLIRALAPSFDAKVVDILTPFTGHELDYTYIASGGVHPNATGYGVVANQLVAAAEAPEPGTLTLLALGAMGMLGLRTRRPKAA